MDTYLLNSDSSNLHHEYNKKWGKFAFVGVLLTFLVAQVMTNLSLKITTNYYNEQMAFFQTQFMNIFLW